ncbi:MAG: zinc finger domain-containing protein [Thermoplasmata archaeon]
MLTKIENCSSCGIRMAGRGNTSFLCPNCGKTSIGRCRQCRNQSVKYKCPECGFVGP